MARKLIFGLDLKQAIQQLDQEARELEPENLFDMQPEDAFAVGFETALHRLKEITGEDPSVLELRTVSLETIATTDGHEIGGVTTTLEEK